MINYTSGTTSASKGVMLSYRSMWSNLKYALDKMGYNPGERLVSILTMAHMYGLAFELIYPFASGTHVYFISKTPAPKIINETPGTATTGKISYQAIPENPLSEPQIKAVDPG